MIKTNSILLVLFTITSFVFSYYGPPFFPVLYFLVWCTLVVLVDIKKATVFYLLVMLIDGDVSKFGPLEEASYISVYTTYIFGKSLSLIWTVLNFLLLIIVYFKTKKLSVDRYIFPFLILLAISLCMAIANDKFLINIFVSDLGYFINLFTGYLAVFLFIKTGKEVLSFFSCVMIILVTKSFLIAIDSVLMSFIGFFNTYAVETGAYLVPIALCYSFLTYSNNRFKSAFSMTSFFLFLIISASRGRILIAGVSLLFSSYIAGKKKAVLALFACLPIIFLFIVMWNPDTANYFLWKITTFVPSAEDANGKVESMSSMVRFIELLNIVGLHLDKIYTLIFGTGLSGYFTADYFSFPFNLYGTNSYPDEWISNNTYYKPHGSLLYVLLKFGLVGYLCIFGTVFLLVKRAVRVFKSQALPIELSYILISIASFLPFLFIVNFSSKLQIFSGVFFAILSFLVKYKD